MQGRRPCISRRPLDPGGDVQGVLSLDPARASLQWALPLDPARGIMPLDPLLLYNIAPKVTGEAVTFGALL